MEAPLPSFRRIRPGPSPSSSSSSSSPQPQPRSLLPLSAAPVRRPPEPLSAPSPAKRSRLSGAEPDDHRRKVKADLGSQLRRIRATLRAIDELPLAPPMLRMSSSVAGSRSSSNASARRPPRLAEAFDARSKPRKIQVLDDVDDSRMPITMSRAGSQRKDQTPGLTPASKRADSRLGQTSKSGTFSSAGQPWSGRVSMLNQDRQKESQSHCTDRFAADGPGPKENRTRFDKAPATPESHQDISSKSQKLDHRSARNVGREHDKIHDRVSELEKKLGKRESDRERGQNREWNGECKVPTPPMEPIRSSWGPESASVFSVRLSGASASSGSPSGGFPMGSPERKGAYGTKASASRPSPSRWTVSSCHAQYASYRETAHAVKKQADALVQSPGGLSRVKWGTAQVMWTDSLLLYAYASWARDQHLRFVPGGITAYGDTVDPGVPAPLAMECSTDQRGVTDWSLLIPLFEHTTLQLRKSPSTWSPVLDALLLTLRARILLMCAIFSAGQMPRRLSRLSSAKHEVKSTELTSYGDQLALALAEMDRAREMENTARASLSPSTIQTEFPCSWLALGTPSADPKTATNQTLALDPSSFAHITLGTGFHFECPGRPGPAGPVFPPPDGSEGTAHLIMLGRMLVAETARREGLDYELASVDVPLDM